MEVGGLNFVMNQQSLPSWTMFGKNKTVAESKPSQDPGFVIGFIGPTPCRQKVIQVEKSFL